MAQTIKTVERSNKKIASRIHDRINSDLLELNASNIAMKRLIKRN
jgi:hypothetical protein